MKKQFAVYILSNKYHTVLYTDITNNLVRRVSEHREGNIRGFSQKYHVTKLVYYELCDDPLNAITREKQIKNLVRRKKNEMITAFNPLWKDLYQDIL